MSSIVQSKVLTRFYAPCQGCGTHEHRIDTSLADTRPDSTQSCPECGVTTRFSFDYETKVVSAEIVPAPYQPGLALLEYEDAGVPLLIVVDTTIGQEDIASRSNEMSAWERITTAQRLNEETGDVFFKTPGPAWVAYMEFLLSARNAATIRDLTYSFDITTYTDDDLAIWLDNYLDDHQWPVGYVLPYRLCNLDSTYREHTCPTNYLGVRAIQVDADHDPHGCFTLKSFATHQQLLDAVKSESPHAKTIDDIDAEHDLVALMLKFV